MLVKQKLLQGKKVCLAWNHSGSNYISEIYAHAGFDGVILDMEHGPFSLESTVQHCHAVQSTNTHATAMVRVVDGQRSTVRRVLDTGVQGLLIPQISSVEEAQEAIAATKYPPSGTRGVAGSCRAAGFGHNSLQYFEKADNDIFVALVIETVEGYHHLEKILALKGYDAIFIGPVDLASSMGHLGTPQKAEVQEAIKDIEKKVIASQKYLGSIASTEEEIMSKFELGYNLLTLMSDVLHISTTAHRLIEKFNKI